MKKTIFLLMLFFTIASHAQYNLKWGEHAYLPIPDPPFNGYVAHATWNVNNSNLTFEEADEAGAIIYPNHYFEGTSLVTCSYRYEYYRNGRYQSGMSSVSYTVSFNSVNAVIDKSSISLSVGQTETIKASFPGGTSISGSPKMTWKSSDDYIVSVSDKPGSTNRTAKIKAEASGKARITFDPIIGPPVYCDVEVAYIAPNKVELTPNPLQVTTGKSKTLKITYYPEGASAKSLTWTSANTNIATVNSKGIVKGVGEGETTITIETDNGVTATAKVVVLPLPTAVSIPVNIDIALGYSKTIVPTVTPSNSESTYKWSSSDTSVATVSSGTVKGKKEGRAVITVTTENGKTAECAVNIKAVPIELDYRNATNRASAVDNLVTRSLKNK